LRRNREDGGPPSLRRIVCYFELELDLVLDELELLGDELFELLELGDEVKPS
jgi:hypothetical protein